MGRGGIGGAGAEQARRRADPLPEALTVAHQEDRPGSARKFRAVAPAAFGDLPLAGKRPRQPGAKRVEDVLAGPVWRLEPRVEDGPDRVRGRARDGSGLNALEVCSVDADVPLVKATHYVREAQPGLESHLAKQHPARNIALRAMHRTLPLVNPEVGVTARDPLYRYRLRTLVSLTYPWERTTGEHRAGTDNRRRAGIGLVRDIDAPHSGLGRWGGRVAQGVIPRPVHRCPERWEGRCMRGSLYEQQRRMPGDLMTVLDTIVQYLQ